MIKITGLPKQILFGTTSALLLFLAWPPNGVTFLIFVAFIPLFILGTDREIGLTNYFIVCYVTFFVFHLLAAGWMYSSTFVGTLIAHLVHSFLFALVFLLWVASRNVLRKPGIFLLLSLWLSMEYLQSHWDLAWPWFTLGNGLAEKTSWIQWFSFTGVSGGTLWVILINWLIFKIITTIIEVKWKQFGIFFGMLILIILGPILLSGTLLQEEKQFEKIKIALVQPNINPRTEKFFGLNEQEQLNRTLKLIADHDLTEVKLVVFPETFLTNPIDEDSLAFSSSLLQIVRQLSNYRPISILVGAFTKIHSSKASFDIDVILKTGNPHILYNSSILINDYENRIYHKMNLLPLVEKQPFLGILKPFKYFIEKSGAYFGSYGTHNEQFDFVLNDGTAIAPIICFESVFSESTAELVRKTKANMIVLITNDGWWSSDVGYKQHLAYAKLRCIETGNWMARCANTGVSAVIDNHGEIRTQSDYGKAEILISEIGLNRSKNSFYVENGDIIGKTSVILLGMIVCLLMYNSGTIYSNNRKQNQ